jgi:hypothetical protein
MAQRTADAVSEEKEVYWVRRLRRIFGYKTASVV